MRILLALLSCLLAGASTAEAETVIRSEILTAGKPSGEQVATYRDDGTISVQYSFNDRGRGPDIDATYRLAEDGTLVESRLTGLAYFKTAVDERFTLAEGVARWRNGSDDGQAEPEQPVYYLGLETTPEDGAILARALLQAPDGRLALLPAGEARIEHLADREIGGQKLGLYAIHGLGLTPELIWLDADRHFHASVSAWFAMIRAGSAAQVPMLMEAERIIVAEQRLALTRRLTRDLDAPLLIANVRAFDPGRGGFVGNSVLIDAGRIVDVGTDLDLPEGGERIDGGGRFLMPGLWDMHVHHAGEADGLLHLAHGVTTVRDMANDNELLARRETDFDAGRDLGPRILKAGFLDGSGPFAGPTKALVDSEDDVREWIDRYAAEGYQQIKLYSSLKRGLVQGAIDYAHEKGLRVSGHVPVGLSAHEFVLMGADELQHINFIFLNFVADAGADTRTPLRFSLVGDHGGKLDLTGAPVREFIALLKSRDVVVDPTLVAFEDMYTSQPKLPPTTYAAVIGRLPATWRRRVAAGGGGLPAADGSAVLRHRAAYERMIALVGELHRSGVTIVAGTDAAAGLSYVRELELYVQAGIPPVEVLRIATVNAARTMKLDGERGRLAPGQVSDLILVDGDPTRIVSDLRRVHTVIRGDRLFDSLALGRAAGLSDP